MRKLLHIVSLWAAMLVWLLGVFLGFEQPFLGFAGTCCTLALLFLAQKMAENPVAGPEAGMQRRVILKPARRRANPLGRLVGSSPTFPVPQGL